MYTYKAKVIRVVDGDTLDAVVDMGFYMSAQIRFRIKNFDSPESWRPQNEAERLHASEANTFAKTLLENQVVTLTSFKEGVYNRWDAIITLLDGRDYATVMIEGGFQKRPSY